MDDLCITDIDNFNKLSSIRDYIGVGLKGKGIKQKDVEEIKFIQNIKENEFYSDDQSNDQKKQITKNVCLIL